MTRDRAELLVALLAELEAECDRIPPEYRRSLQHVKALALLEVTFGGPVEHSVKVPPPRLRVVSADAEDRSVRGRTIARRVL